MPENIPNNADAANTNHSTPHCRRMPEGTSVAVEAGDNYRLFDPAELCSDDEFRGELAETCCNSDTPPTFFISTLLNLEDDHRWMLLEFIKDCNGRCPVEDADEPRSLFDAVLHLMVDHHDIERCQRGQRAAIEAAVLIHGNALGPACSRISQQLQTLRVTGIRTDDILREARVQAESLAATADEHDERGEEQTPLKVNYPDAPVSDDAVVPPGWNISEDGISREAGGDQDEIKVICSTPIVITGRLTTEDAGTEAIRLDWKRDGEWNSRIVDRVVLATTRTVVELASYGVAVTSNNANQIVQYVSDYEAANINNLPRARVTNHLGWQGANGSSGFLWGRTLITNDGTHAGVDMNEVAPHEWPAGAIAFRGNDEGDNQLADGFRQDGHFECWSKAVEPLVRFPRVMLAIYSSLTTPLLQILNSPNFVVDFCGPTSQGKTITLRAAASCWGCPDEKSPSAAITTWDSTRVFIEGACSVQADLPLVVDDTKRAKRKDGIAQIIYDVTSGRSRGRGSLHGLRRSGTFRTVLLMNGEAPATSFTEDGGTRARVLTLWGSPFEGTDSGTANVVNELDRSLRRHYGHAGPQLVTYLLSNHDQWSSWRKDYRQLQRGYERRAGNNSVANRMSAHFAAINMAARLAHEAMDLPWEYSDPIEPLWETLVAEAEEADRAEAALRHVVSWASAHQAEFWGRHRLSSGGMVVVPNQGWAGRWNCGSKEQPAPYIGFFPNRLKQILEEGGFEPEAIVRTWRDRGWLELTHEGEKTRARLKARVDGVVAGLVAIKQEAVTALDGEPTQPSVPAKKQEAPIARRKKKPSVKTTKSKTCKKTKRRIV